MILVTEHLGCSPLGAGFAGDQPATRELLSAVATAQDDLLLARKPTPTTAAQRPA